MNTVASITYSSSSSSYVQDDEKADRLDEKSINSGNSSDEKEDKPKYTSQYCTSYSKVTHLSYGSRTIKIRVLKPVDEYFLKEVFFLTAGSSQSSESSSESKSSVEDRELPPAGKNIFQYFTMYKMRAPVGTLAISFSLYRQKSNAGSAR